MKTLTGKTMDQVREILDAPLPPQAYKPVPGPGGFTDIDSNFQNRIFNNIFGLCGLGWGFDFRSEDVDVRMEVKPNGKDAAEAVIKKVVLWYIMVGDKGQQHKCEVPSSGANRNEFGNAGYALKGALTSALGAAASKLGWQESIYLGIRSHLDPSASAPARPTTAAVDPVANVAPPLPPAPAPQAGEVPAPALRFFRCFNNHVVTESGAVTKCPKCGSMGIREFPTLAEARAFTQQEPPPAAQAPQPQAPQPQAQQPQAPAPLPQGEQAPATSYSPDPTCLLCGSMFPPGTKVCENCGIGVYPLGDTKAMHEEIKRITNNNRSAWLSAAGKATGRSIKSYSECSTQDLHATIRYLLSNPPAAQSAPPPASAPAQAAPPSPPANVGAGGSGAPVGQGTGAPPDSQAQGSAPRPQSKLELVKRVFAVGAAIGLVGAPAVLNEVSNRFRRPITSSAQLTIEELNQFLDEIEYQAAKGQ